LGRRQLFEHGREILRASGSNTHTYAYGHSKRYSNSDAERDTNAKSYTHAASTAHTSAKTIGLKPNDEIRISNDELIANDI
jgi:hypothetical protein